jgi:hypothetical protein
MSDKKDKKPKKKCSEVKYSNDFNYHWKLHITFTTTEAYLEHEEKLQSFLSKVWSKFQRWDSYREFVLWYTCSRKEINELRSQAMNMIGVKFVFYERDL